MTTDAELRERIARLEDRAEIRACMTRYARGIDRRDRKLLRSAYHDGAVDDHVGFIGQVDDFIDWAFAYHSTQTRYQHYLLKPANHKTISGGRYVDRLERRDGPWAIVDRVCVVVFNTEAESQITEEVIAMMTRMRIATHDSTDPSYGRPLIAKRAGGGP